MNWKNIYRGFLMGISDVIPGVSGGTIAVLLGIYDRLIAAINGLLSREWKKHLAFLIPLAIGAGGAILLFSRIIKWLFEYYPQPTQFFFLGLIIGILPYLFKEADAKRNFTGLHIFLLVVGIGLCASLLFIHPERTQAVIEVHSLSTYAFIFLSGVVASAAMILPGISGSFMLLVMGVYHTIIAALSDFVLPILITMGLGILVGLLFTSKLIHFCLNHFRNGTLAVVIGLVIGSIAVVFPGFPTTGFLALSSVLTFAVGLLTAYLLGRVEYT